MIRAEVMDEEVNETIRKMRNKKSPGEDTITDGMLKYGVDMIIKIIIKMIKQMFLTARIPEKWEGRHRDNF
jgi:hypothetical protein